MNTNQNTLTWTAVKRKVSDLLPADYNPRRMTENERRDLEDSIKEFGTVVPVVLNIGGRNNTIIGGHQRVGIYADLGITEIETMVPSRELTESEEQRLNLRLNKNIGGWDEDKLKLFDIDTLLDIGFGDDELQALFDDMDVIDDDFDVEKALKDTVIAKVKPGELWALGEHRLLVGDSTDSEQVKRLMGTDLADLIYCDPLTTFKAAGKDSKKDAAYALFVDLSIKAALSVAKPNAHFFYWTDEQYIGLLQTLYRQNTIAAKRVCLWIRSNFNTTPQTAFTKAYEPCVYGTIGTPHLSTGTQNTSEVLNKEVTSGNQIADEILDSINLWIAQRDSGESSTHKPVTLSEKPLKRCSAPGHIIFSGFTGVGSDLIACEQLGRKWRGIEIDPVIATVCIDRWEAFTNNRATRI